MDLDVSRRAVLRRGTTVSFGLAALAGCAGRSPDAAGTDAATTRGGSPPEATTTAFPTATEPTASATPPPDATRRVTVESVTERPDIPELDARIGALAPYATPEHPPLLRATVENPGDRPVELDTRIEAVLWPMHSEQRSPGVSVGPGWSGEGPCWQARGTVTQLGTSRPITLDPGERESSTLSVLGYRGNEDVCLPTGRFRFVDDFPSLGARDWTVEFSLRIDAVE